MYSKKDWAKVGVLALLMVMCIVSFAFEYIHIKMNAIFTTVTASVSGFGALFKGIPVMFEEQVGTISVITIIGILASVVGLIIVLVNAFKKNEITNKLVGIVFVIAVAICVIHLIGFATLNGAIPAESASLSEVTTGWFIMPIIAVVLLLAYFAVNKFMED